jgi:hypothetical protein
VNKDLNGKVYNIPEDIIKKINETLTTLGTKWADGRQRAENLMSTKKVNYGQLKRIIHDLNGVDKVNEKTKYDLYGGELMEKWAKTFLDGERQLVKNNKTASKKINNNTAITGLRKNPFLKTHEKKETTKISPNMFKSNSDKTSVSPITSLGLFEEIQKIKNIINY